MIYRPMIREWSILLNEKTLTLIILDATPMAKDESNLTLITPRNLSPP
jgi:hypothetical protein